MTGRIPMVGGGWLVNVHDPVRCAGRGCPIHHPSGHPMRTWPLAWDDDLRCCRRLCEHGVAHYDPDDVAYQDTVGRDVRVHVCDGCCRIAESAEQVGYDHEAIVQRITAALRHATRAGADPGRVIIEAVSLATTELKPGAVRDDPVAAGRELLFAGLMRIARAGGDVADAVANALARAAAAIGGSEELLAGRLGSWEASLVRQLLAGTVGPEDEMLGQYGEDER